MDTMMDRHSFEPMPTNSEKCELCGCGKESGIHIPQVTTETGAKRSNEYPPGAKFPARYDLVMRNGAGLRRLAETFGEGFKKYGADNCYKGFKESVYLSHALEHIRLHEIGDTKEDHIAHATWNLFMLMWTQENKPELCDLTKIEQKP